MTLRWIDGFENHRHFDLIRNMYDSFSGSNPANTQSLGRKVGFCIITSQSAQWTTPSLVPSVGNTWIIQWAIRKNTSGSMVGTPGVEILDKANGLQLELRMINGVGQGNFRYEVFRGATSLGVTADFRWGSRRAWHVFQVKVVIRTGANGSVELKHWDYLNNATTVLNLSAINTANLGTDGADQIKLKLNTQVSDAKSIDDFVVMDGSGSVNNNLTAVPIVVFGQLPAADGASSAWVPSAGGTHASMVNGGPDIGTNNNDLTSDTIGNLDQFGMLATPINEMAAVATPTILGIQIDTVGAMRNSGSRTVKINVDDPGGGNADVAGQDMVWNNLVTDSRVVILEQNPVSVAAWTRADIIDHLIGIKLTA